MWNNDCNLAAATSAGVSFERLEIDWSSIEPRPGRWNFSAYDKQFAVAARHGVTVLPLLMNVPAWAGPAWNALPAHTRAYASYVARVVRRYGPHGSFWRTHRDIPARPPRGSRSGTSPTSASSPPAGKPGPLRAPVQVRGDGGTARRPVRSLPDRGRPQRSRGKRLLLSLGRPDVRSCARPEPLGRRRGGAPLYRDPTRRTPTRRPTLAGTSSASCRSGGSSPPTAAAPSPSGSRRWAGRPVRPTPRAAVSELDQAAYLKRVFQLVKSDYSSWVKAVFPYNYRDGSRETEHGQGGLVRADPPGGPAEAGLERAEGGRAGLSAAQPPATPETASARATAPAPTIARARAAHPSPCAPSHASIRSRPRASRPQAAEPTRAPPSWWARGPTSWPSRPPAIRAPRRRLSRSGCRHP